MSILHTHREGICYLEHARVIVKDGMVNVVRQEKATTRYWTIPVANVCVLLLGPGTSLSQMAARELSSHGVLVAFVGGGGVPVFMGSQSEYRKPEYLQAWIAMWSNPETRLATAISFCETRTQVVEKSWEKIFDSKLIPYEAIACFKKQMRNARSIQRLMGYEAGFAKSLYSMLSHEYSNGGFRRIKKGEAKQEIGTPSINALLSSGNYLAYGLAACCLWVLGIPHSLPVSHGATRRGALVFDVADLVKDACVMPQAFLSHFEGHTAGKFKEQVLINFENVSALELMFQSIKDICKNYPPFIKD